MSEFDKMLENYIHNELTKPDHRMQPNFTAQNTAPAQGAQTCGNFQV